MGNFISPDFVEKGTLPIRTKKKVYTLIAFDDLPVHGNGGKVIEEILLVMVAVNNHWENI